MHNKIPLAHVNIQGIDCAIFGADARIPTNQARGALLAGLTSRARMAGLAVSKRALAFSQGGRLTFFGDRDLVAYLTSNAWAVSWTHEIEA
ncbi:MAG: hypothetical protein KC621_03680 [Myxococcales bacterium]|nr:hypothetical protein [Myxococcales bacterium]